MNRMTEDRMFTRRRFLVGYAGAVATSIAGTGLIERKVYSASRRDEKSLPVIDTHMHVWSGDPKRFPLVHPYNPNSEAPKVAGTVEMLLEEMKQYGVTHCVLVQVIYHGWDNSYVAHCVKLHPERFRGHGLIDPTDPEVASKLEYWMIEHGLSGMRFSPIYYKGKDDWMTSDAHHALWKKASSLSAVFKFFI
ncbi:MAG: amidohydrolase, partial [Planctomycetes bacterium]|nr:amidohydrolase [Planctomycetota bacterium]